MDDEVDRAIAAKLGHQLTTPADDSPLLQALTGSMGASGALTARVEEENESPILTDDEGRLYWRENGRYLNRAERRRLERETRKKRTPSSDITEGGGGP